MKDLKDFALMLVMLAAWFVLWAAVPVLGTVVAVVYLVRKYRSENAYRYPPQYGRRRSDWR